MSKRFTDISVNQKERYLLGRDEQSGDYYLSIPVANQIADYEEYYRLSDHEYKSFTEDEKKAAAFADPCRKRLHDDKLILQPGNDRGVAI